MKNCGAGSEGETPAGRRPGHCSPSGSRLELFTQICKARTPIQAIISRYRLCNSFLNRFANQIIMFKKKKHIQKGFFTGKAFYSSSHAKLAGELYNYSAFANKINLLQVCTRSPLHTCILWRMERIP